MSSSTSIMLMGILLITALNVSAVDKIEIRGPIVEVVDGANYMWGVQDFAGFYYNIDDNLGVERIRFNIIDNTLCEPDGIIYETEAQKDDFNFDEWGSYYSIGFLGEKQFAGYEESSCLYDEKDIFVKERICKVLMDEEVNYEP